MTLLAPEQLSSVSSPFFGDALHRHGQREALVTANSVLSYSELDAEVGRLAAELGTVRRLVAVEAANTVEAVVAYLAALRAGHPILLLPPGSDAEGHPVLAEYDPDVVMAAAASWRPKERRIGTAHELHPDLALLVPTSGSTGSAKLVRLSRDNLQANAAAISEYLRLTPDDRAITSLPMHYCYGLSVLNSHLLSGASVVLTQLSVVDGCFWDLFRRTRATSFAGVPYTFELLDRVGFDSMDLPHLRYVTQAGGRMRLDQVSRYAQLGADRGWELFVMYGQTEATARMA